MCSIIWNQLKETLGFNINFFPIKHDIYILNKWYGTQGVTYNILFHPLDYPELVVSSYRSRRQTKQKLNDFALSQTKQNYILSLNSI